jgi:hypothetical protein
LAAQVVADELVTIDIDLEVDQLGDERRELIDLAFGESNFDNDVLTVDPSASCNPSRKAANASRADSGLLSERSPIRATFSACCAVAASGDMRERRSLHGDPCP